MKKYYFPWEHASIKQETPSIDTLKSRSRDGPCIAIN